MRDMRQHNGFYMYIDGLALHTSDRTMHFIFESVPTTFHCDQLASTSGLTIDIGSGLFEKIIFLLMRAMISCWPRVRSTTEVGVAGPGGKGLEETFAGVLSSAMREGVCVWCLRKVSGDEV